MTKRIVAFRSFASSPKDAIKSRNGVVGVETRLRDGRPGFRIPVGGQEIFLFPKTPREALGPTQSPIQWAQGFFSGAKVVKA